MKPQVPAWHLHELLADDAIVCGDSGTVTTWVGPAVKLRAGSGSASAGRSAR